MEQRTCNIIMCCKGHCRLPGHDDKSSRYQDIVYYLANECGCDVSTYSRSLIASVLKTALIDFFKVAEDPGHQLWMFLNNMSDYNMDMVDAIISLFTLVEIKNDWGYVNGFNHDIIQRSYDILMTDVRV